jgi:hypothetical protein
MMSTVAAAMNVPMAGTMHVVVTGNVIEVIAVPDVSARVVVQVRRVVPVEMGRAMIGVAFVQAMVRDVREYSSAITSRRPMCHIDYSLPTPQSRVESANLSGANKGLLT